MKVPCFDCSCREHGCSFINYGVYLNASFMQWISSYPNLSYILVDVLERKEESK